MRRLYTLLNVDGEGNLKVMRACRTISEEEKYKCRYCKDVALDKEGYLQLNITFKSIQDDKEKETRVKVIKERQEKATKKREEENLVQQRYAEEYDKKYGKTTKPEELLKEKERLDKEMEKLGKELEGVRLDLGNINKQLSKIK